MKKQTTKKKPATKPTRSDRIKSRIVRLDAAIAKRQARIVKINDAITKRQDRLARLKTLLKSL